MLLRAELSAPSWEPSVLAMSGVTDCYQPVERTLRLTRRCLEVLAEFRNPVGVVTKNALVARDADVLADLASDRLRQRRALGHDAGRGSAARARAADVTSRPAARGGGAAERRRRPGRRHGRADHPGAERPRDPRDPGPRRRGGGALRRLHHAAAALRGEGALRRRGWRSTSPIAAPTCSAASTTSAAAS